MQMKKALRQIPPIYRMIAGFLILFGVLVFCKREPYLQIFEEGRQYHWLSFLQEGQYEIQLTYEGYKPGERIFVYSDSMTDDLNQVGVTLAETVVPEYAGIVALSFTLSDGTHDIFVTSDSETGYFAQGKIQSVRLQNRDPYFLLILFSLTGLFFLYGGYRRYFEKHPVPFILTGLGLLVSIPLFSDFLYAGDDIYFHLARIEGIYQALRGGQFPVRVNAVQNKGYGNLSAAMYPSFFLMPFALLRYMKVSLMLCYKSMLVSINIATALISYCSVKKLCNSHKIGMWASILYTFSAYRLNNLYMRCAIGEALAMAFLPLLLWGTYELLWRDERKWYILMLGMTCVIQSHVLSTEICALFMTAELVIWLFSSSRKRFVKRLVSGIKAVVVTALLNAGFLVPFACFSMQDLQCFHMENYIAEFTAYFTQMFAMFMPVNGTSGSVGSTQEEMALSAGLILLLGAVLFCVNQMRDRESDGRMGKIGRRCFAYGVVGLFLSSWLFPWSRLLEMEWFKTLSSPLQFPWRFLGIASVFLCVVTAIAIETVHGKLQNYVKLLVIGLTICSTGYCFDMLCQQKEALGDKMEIEAVSLSDSMYMYYISDQFEAWHLQLSRDEARITCLDSSEVSYSDYEKRGMSIRVTTQNPGDAEDLLVFPLCYFPGYVIEVDGERVETKIHSSPIPMVACDLPEQTAHITVAYEGLWIFKVGDVISLVTAGSLAAAAVLKRRKAGASL